MYEYFVWPERPDQTVDRPGVVWKADVSDKGATVVELSDGTKLCIFYGIGDDGEPLFLVVRPASEAELLLLGGQIVKAKKIFGLDDSPPTFTGLWMEMVTLSESINAAAAVNELFVVLLTPETYEELQDDDKFAIFTQGLTEWAKSLVQLREESCIDFDHPGQPAIDLYRICGRCQ